MKYLLLDESLTETKMIKSKKMNKGFDSERKKIMIRI